MEERQKNVGSNKSNMKATFLDPLGQMHEHSIVLGDVRCCMEEHHLQILVTFTARKLILTSSTRYLFTVHNSEVRLLSYIPPPHPSNSVTWLIMSRLRNECSYDSLTRSVGRSVMIECFVIALSQCSLPTHRTIHPVNPSSCSLQSFVPVFSFILFISLFLVILLLCYYIVELYYFLLSMINPIEFIHTYLRVCAHRLFKMYSSFVFAVCIGKMAHPKICIFRKSKEFFMNKRLSFEMK